MVINTCEASAGLSRSGRFGLRSHRHSDTAVAHRQDWASQRLADSSATRMLGAARQRQLETTSALPLTSGRDASVLAAAVSKQTLPTIAVVVGACHLDPLGEVSV